MNIKYDIDKLNQIILDFYKITGIPLIITDRNFHRVAQLIWTRYDFCKIIQKYNSRLCIESDNIIIKKCSETRCAAFHTCFAGLLDAALPIIIKNEIAGYVLLGQIRKSSDFPDLSHHIPQYLTAELEAQFDFLPKYNEDQMESIIRIADAFVTKIVEDEMIIVDAKELSSMIAEYINENLENNLSIDKLCHYFNISKNKLYESFHKYFGTTVNEFITSKRIETSKKLLTDTSFSTDIIAEKSGFSETTYFYKVFKRYTGITPKEYRKIKKIES